MNVETASRLMQYRKKAGLSQEELADKLGVSRQAVSKWECAESSPDTDNLIALSKIYGVSLDELINDDPKQKESNKEEGVHVHIKDEDGSEVKVSGIKVHLKDDEGNEVNIGNGGVEIVDGGDKVKVDTYFHKRGNHKLKVAEDIISSLAVLGAIVAYLLCGFLVKDGWRNYWIVFFIIPIAPTILPAIHYRKFTIFAYPLLVVAIYLALGMFLGAWHPWWALFFTIPAYYIIFGPIDRLISRKIKVDDKVIDAHDYDEGND